MPDTETPIEAILPKEQTVEEAKESPKTPVPTATGNEKVAVLKHGLSHVNAQNFCLSCHGQISIEVVVKNISDSTLATIVFKALFYDIEGNILDTVEQKTFDLKPSASRAVGIGSLTPEYRKVKSYNVKITKITTTDVEKVQLRVHERRKGEDGEEIIGIVKNLSEVKTDAALVVTFYNPEKENIGTKVLVLRDLEPDTVRQFKCKFNQQEGDRVKTYSLAIGDIVE